MAIEYRLIVATRNPVEDLANRAFPDPDEHMSGTPPLLLTDLNEKYGFGVTAYAGRDGYLEAEADNGMWEWKPSAFVRFTFHMNKKASLGPSLRAMVGVVERVLDSGAEDVSLDLNGNWLLLTRIDGVVTKHKQADWWDVHGLS
ncbi:hypothetical protein GCM10010168_46220 [Actinoplanes ianthinogenes]|uniref:Uncharacterized protein n=2 Tax=Actinoplanes ianthinogenes TaxID=122358 RepID=A0ABM7LPE4_9ACTN|nr:hypothetical protein Aiant_17370 [Actinoplanes ianthinogenes]GGR23028.1 hypothetical protein GCM10010168_46220 [Actinoplanes ianthinogenes]